MQAFEVRSVRDVIDNDPVETRLDLAPDPQHEELLRGWEPKLVRDRRTALTYRFGPTIREPGIAERWAKFEADYLSISRLSTFWTAVVEDAVVDDKKLAVVSGSRIVRETARTSKELASLFPATDASLLRKAISKPGTPLMREDRLEPQAFVDEAVLLGSGMYENYFNWIIRYAANIRTVLGFDRSVAVLCPKPVKAYVRETLAMLGIEEARIVWLDKPTYVRRLHLIAPIAKGRYELSPLMISNLQRNPRVKAIAAGASERIYVPRFQVAMRRVVNEQELIGALRGLGFDVFDSATHTIQQQVSAFRGAKMIVSAHGAGLSNIVYSAPGAEVVEITPEGYDQGVTSYRSLSDLFGHTYTPLFAREVKLDKRGNRCNSDIEIDVAEVCRTIEALLAPQP